MVLAALLTVSISLPARAVNADTSGALAPVGSNAAAAPAQSLSVSTASTAAIVRDDFTSKAAPPKPKAKPQAAVKAAAAGVSPAPSVVWPFPGQVPIAGGFGPRVPPCAGCSSFHKGLDMNPGAGTPIRAVAGGVVRFASAYDNGGLGVHVIIDHRVGGQLVSSVYGHMVQGSLAVHQGQSVGAGQRLGNVGTTGQSTGPHLHFEILLGGVTPTDPYAWLTARAGRP
jgi:murein DD-endopeptidase MepM/ murein hydrolase activator NlpD